MRRANVTTAARQALLALMIGGPAFSYDRGVILVLSAEQSPLAHWLGDRHEVDHDHHVGASIKASRSLLSPSLPLSFRLCIFLLILICRRGAATASSSPPSLPSFTSPHCRGRRAPRVELIIEGQ
ncbi:hypothetical protein ABZX51_010002 [Aspergillus tubingensis]